MTDSIQPVPQPPSQPGQVITPGGAAGTGQPPESPEIKPPEAPAPPPPAPVPAAPPPQEPASSFAAAPFNNSEASPQSESPDAVTWTASEFVAHEKSFSWFLALGVIAVLVAAVVYLVTRDVVSTTVVIVCALLLGVVANRKPRQMQYSVSAGGVTIGNKHYDFGSFKSFSVVPEGAFSSVIFMPLKRFAPLTTIYYPPEDEDKILNLLSSILPMEEHKPDTIDSVARRIRF